MKKTRFTSLAAAIICFTHLSCIHAGTTQADDKTPRGRNDWEAAFARGAFDLQIAVGAEISFQDTGPSRPNIDYATAVARLGYMLDNVHGSGWWRGNDELMIEAVGGPIYTGPGSALGGVTLIYRRNFVQPAARVVPYFNVGIGGIYSDAYHQRTQHALGSPFEFDLLGGGGLRYRLTPRWSLDGEIDYRHLSNAGLASRNYGTNAFGGLLGLSYTF